MPPPGGFFSAPDVALHQNLKRRFISRNSHGEWPTPPLSLFENSFHILKIIIKSLKNKELI